MRRGEREEVLGATIAGSLFEGTELGMGFSCTVYKEQYLKKIVHGNTSLFPSREQITSFQEKGCRAFLCV